MVTLAPVGEGDEEQIVALYQRVFDRPYERARWAWQYRENPRADLSQVIVAREGETGAVVGHTASVPLGFSVDGQEVVGGRVQNVFVHPEFRRQGVFTRLLGRLHERLRQAAPVVLTFPNDQSVRAMVRTGFYAHLGEVYAWRRSLGGLSDVVPEQLRVSVAGPESFSDEDVTLLHRVRAGHRFWGRRDRTFLAWRFGRASGRHYRVVRIHRGDALLGLGVFKGYEAGIDAVELALGADDEHLLLPVLLRTAAETFCGAKYVELWSAPHESLHSTLVEHGFARVKRPTHVLARVDAAVVEQKTEWAELRHWSLSMADSDVY